MNDATQNLLLMLVAFQVKHVICDGPLQTLRMVKDKAVYGKPQGLLHGAIHAVGSFLVLAAFGVSLPSAFAFGVLDGIIHYHIDFSKENTVTRIGWGYSDGPFWWSIITDQSLHHITYLFLAWLALKP
jgi:Protein of unknown function (DUF3307)